MVEKILATASLEERHLKENDGDILHFDVGLGDANI